jgi:hypothetical protein
MSALTTLYVYGAACFVSGFTIASIWRDGK